MITTTRRQVMAGMAALLLCGSAAAADIEILIADDEGGAEGLNDPTSVSPVGLNPGTTLGDQRLFALEYAAAIWAALLESDVTIKVRANFDGLTCEPASAVLGSAGPRFVFFDFPNVSFADTWYPQALANAIAGSDQNTTPPGDGDDDAGIQMRMNSTLDQANNCLGGATWYYGLDDNAPSGAIDILPTILHELGHGLGFTTFVDEQTGERFNGRDDVYMKFLRDTETGTNWPDMTDGERQASAINDPDLVWTGPAVQAMAPVFVTESTAFSNGFIRMHGPDPVEPGSSVSHWTSDASPNLLMEPVKGPGVFDEVDLTIDLFKDIGWTTTEDEIFANGFEALTQ